MLMWEHMCSTRKMQRPSLLRPMHREVHLEFQEHQSPSKAQGLSGGWYDSTGSLQFFLRAQERYDRPFHDNTSRIHTIPTPVPLTRRTRVNSPDAYSFSRLLL